MRRKITALRVRVFGYRCCSCVCFRELSYPTFSNSIVPLMDVVLDHAHGLVAPPPISWATPAKSCDHYSFTSPPASLSLLDYIQMTRIISALFGNVKGARSTRPVSTSTPSYYFFAFIASIRHIVAARPPIRTL